jgi:hypothetical protein
MSTSVVLCSILFLLYLGLRNPNLCFLKCSLGFYAYISTYTQKNLRGFMNFEHVCISQKHAFEWGDDTIPHSVDAVQLTQGVANFLIR